jgi:hypothetical protein
LKCFEGSSVYNRFPHGRVGLGLSPQLLSLLFITLTLLWGVLPAFAEVTLALPPKDWMRLLHYQPQNQWRSEAVGESFFLHPDGHSDPQAEWQAEVKAMRGVLTAALTEALKKFAMGDSSETPNQ